MALKVMLNSLTAEVKRIDQLINGRQRILLGFLGELGIAFGGFGAGVSQ